MLLVAQRVLSSAGQRGTNAFVYLHRQTWTTPPSPDVLAREFVQAQIEVQPAGNRVTSYLDVLVPDEWTMDRIDQFLRDALAPRATLPAVFTAGPALVRFDLDRALAGVWRSEVGELYKAVHDLALYTGAVRAA